MDEMYVWTCERDEDHYVITAAPTNASIPGYVCQECGGHLRPSRRFPRDGQPRVGVHMKAAEEALQRHGFYASTSRTVVTEELAR